MLLINLVPVFPLIRYAEHGGRYKLAFLSAIVTLGVAVLLAASSRALPSVLVAALLLYFIGFNFLEGALPSLISRMAPPAERRGARRLFQRAVSRCFRRQRPWRPGAAARRYCRRLCGGNDISAGLAVFARGLQPPAPRQPAATLS